MITVTYYYSACIRIHTAELSVLCDPWFSEGAYDGSWYHYPPVPDPLALLPACDFVYVSHIHPDHYDPAFLRSYLAAHPRARVIIAQQDENHLSRKMRSDGIAHEAIELLEQGATTLAIIDNGSSAYDVDSALVVRRGDDSVVNMNDNLFNAEQIARIKALCSEPITIALLGYTGAGPYPQTYYEDEAVLREKAEAKKHAFFERYRRMRDALDPRVTVPFAGKYVLGGKLHRLNRYRGVADACEVLAFDPRAVVLDDGGDASIDTATLTATRLRRQPYDIAAMEAYASSLEDRPMLYERYLGQVPSAALPLMRLLPKAFASAQRRSLVQRDYYLCFALGSTWFVCNANRNGGESKVLSDVSALEPRSEIMVDPHYLFGLLTCLFHWNNAEIGSQYRTRRVPDLHDRDVQAYLNFFHV